MEDLGSSLKDGLGALGSMSVKGFDRAKQFSQERMGSAVRTEYEQVWEAQLGHFYLKKHTLIDTCRILLNVGPELCKNFNLNS